MYFHKSFVYIDDSVKFDYFSSKSTTFLHSCTACFELPSNISIHVIEPVILVLMYFFCVKYKENTVLSLVKYLLPSSPMVLILDGKGSRKKGSILVARQLRERGGGKGLATKKKYLF